MGNAGRSHTGRTVEEITLDFAAPLGKLADVIIEASVVKNTGDWKSGPYPFDFVISGKHFSHKVTGEKTTEGKIHFATKLRVRVPAGNARVIMFDSPEKMRPLIVNADFAGGKAHWVQFRPVYLANRVILTMPTPKTIPLSQIPIVRYPEIARSVLAPYLV